MKQAEIKDQRLKDIVRRILSVDQPEKIVLYGSRARGENGKFSDFDLALFGKVNMGRIFDVVQEAETLLNIDIVAFNELTDEKFKNRILTEGVIIYESEV